MIVQVTVPFLKEDIDKLQRLTKSRSRKGAISAAVEEYLKNHDSADGGEVRQKKKDVSTPEEKA